MYPDPDPNRSDRPTSILLTGNERHALVVLAAGLAARAGGSFGWADAGRSSLGIDPAVLGAIEERADGRPIEQFRADDFERPIPDPRAMGRVLDPESVPAAFEGRLALFLSLPRILQALAARTTPGARRAAIVFTGLESLPPAYLDRAVVRRELHASLHAQGISFVGAFRGTPPQRLREAFSHEYEVRETPARPWMEATVRPLPTSADAPRMPSLPLREFWAAEHLDEGLPVRW